MAYCKALTCSNTSVKIPHKITAGPIHTHLCTLHVPPHGTPSPSYLACDTPLRLHTLPFIYITRRVLLLIHGYSGSC
jgi:hypothetical protein